MNISEITHMKIYGFTNDDKKTNAIIYSTNAININLLECTNVS